ncbi:hypothetical protein AB6A40_008627 [Gnathostoma spinigerum]|uniref:Uncharacterized protein n=1 Tax=Gnathostoma spinigerum TaxID=75299 RepID=A0ABD6EPX8_9BILA
MAFRCRFPYLLRAGSNLHQSHRGLLSKKFLLQVEWGHGHERMGKFSLGGDYEWIAAVQKKFAGGGMASAIDVDVAVCGADEKDQLDDIIELMYKLRHTKFAADVLPSSEYAIIRAALKHNAVDLLFKVLSDPINYGIFLNEHSACLLVDYLLESNNVAGAAKVATIVMQQEMFSSTLANILCIYALLKWTELSPSQRLFDKVVLPPVKQEEVNEEDQVTLRNLHITAFDTSCRL